MAGVSASRRSFSAWGMSSAAIRPCRVWAVTLWPRVMALSFSYACGTPKRRIAVCIGSAPPPPAAATGGARGARVDFELVQAGEQRAMGQRGMAQGDAHVAQHGAIAQVPLPAADGQLFRQMPEQRIGQAQVAFGVLEVDRVDLVRHGR